MQGKWRACKEVTRQWDPAGWVCVGACSVWARWAQEVEAIRRHSRESVWTEGSSGEKLLLRPLQFFSSGYLLFHLISLHPQTVLHPLPHWAPHSPSPALDATSPTLAPRSPPSAIKPFLSDPETIQTCCTLTASVLIVGSSPSSSHYPDLDILSECVYMSIVYLMEDPWEQKLCLVCSLIHPLM